MLDACIAVVVVSCVVNLIGGDPKKPAINLCVLKVVRTPEHNRRDL